MNESIIYTMYIRRTKENEYELELDNKVIAVFDNNIYSHFNTLEQLLQKIVGKNITHITHNQSQPPVSKTLLYKNFEILSVCPYVKPKEPEQEMFTEFVANEDPMLKGLALFKLIQLLINKINKIEKELEKQNDYKPIVFKIQKV